MSWASVTLHQLKQRLHQSLQRATLCSQAAEEADQSRGDAERGRALALVEAVSSVLHGWNSRGQCLTGHERPELIDS